MSILLALILLSPLAGPQLNASPGTEDLQANVSQFCELLKANDKAGALRFVHPDDLNSFINRREQPFLSWEVLQTEFTSGETALVTVQFEQVISRNTIPVPTRQEWQKTDQGWKIRIKSRQQAYEKTREAFVQANSALLNEELSIYPSQLKIFEITKPKVGSFVLRNGLQSPARVLSFEVDTTLFEVLRIPETVEPGNTGRIRVAYLGDAQEENLQSEAVLRVEQDGEVKTFQVPIIYNYADDVTRWLSQKAGKEMERLGKKATSEKPPIPPSPH